MNRTDIIGELERYLEPYYKTSNFPFQSCTAIVRSMNRDFGFYVVRGRYAGSLDDKFEDRLKKHIEWAREQVPDYKIEDVRAHDLAYDPESRLFIEVTAQQYDERLPKILLMGTDDKRIAFSPDSVNADTTYLVQDFLIFKKGIPYRLACTTPIQFESNGHPKLRPAF